MPELGFWAVADGMGGHDNGEVASAVVIHGLCQSVKQGVALELAIELAHQEILGLNSQRTNSDAAEAKTAMGTTVVALQINADQFKIAWIGDSRGYLFDGKRLKMLTKDHSLKQQLLDMKALDPQDADNFAHGSTITQALGIEGNGFLRVDCVEGSLEEGQVLCLCSDGLTDLVTDGQIEKSLTKTLKKYTTADYEIANDALLQAALKAGGKDNVTVALVGMEKTKRSKAAGSWWGRLLGYFK